MWANDWVATAIFKSGADGPEVSVMLGWTDKFGVSVHVCGGHDENSHRDRIGVQLKPQSSSTTKAEIMHQSENGWDEVMTELIPVSVRVDTRRELSFDALYNVVYNVTVLDDRLSRGDRSASIEEYNVSHRHQAI